MHCTKFYDRGGGKRYYPPTDGFITERAYCRHWRGSWVDQKAGFQVLAKIKISFLVGKRSAPPVFRFSQQSVALGFTPLCYRPVRSGLSDTSTAAIHKKLPLFWRTNRRLVELQRGNANVHQQLAHLRRLQSIRRMQMWGHAQIDRLRSSDFRRFDYQAVKMKFTEIIRGLLTCFYRLSISVWYQHRPRRYPCGSVFLTQTKCFRYGIQRGVCLWNIYFGNWNTSCSVGLFVERIQW